MHHLGVGTYVQRVWKIVHAEETGFRSLVANEFFRQTVQMQARGSGFDLRCQHPKCF